MERRTDRTAIDFLTAEQREFIGRAWLDDGLAEHASVASFARFALLALKLGAPPRLLAAAARAMDDEIRHAKLCFSVAARFLGRNLGPGPFDIGTIGPDDQTPEAILTGTVIEGCVGETIAAAVVRFASEHAEDAAIVRVLTEIADDEARHAELAWDFLAWMLAGVESHTNVARLAFVEALSSFAADGPENVPDIAPRYGILALATKRDVRADTVRGQIVPRAASLLNVPSSSFRWS
jgi:hypothetical protein